MNTDKLAINGKFHSSLLCTAEHQS